VYVLLAPLLELPYALLQFFEFFEYLCCIDAMLLGRIVTLLFDLIPLFVVLDEQLSEP
jgi:hypothetical protein